MKRLAWIIGAAMLVVVSMAARLWWQSEPGVRGDAARLAAVDPGSESAAPDGAWPGGDASRAPRAPRDRRSADGPQQRPAGAVVVGQQPRPGGLRAAPGDLAARAPGGPGTHSAAAVPAVGGALEAAAGAAAKSAADRAQALPDAKQHREKVLDKPAVAKQPGDDPDLLLSVPFKGDVDIEAGVPPRSVEGLSTEGGAVTLGDAAMVQFQADGNINGDAGTIAFSIAPTWAGADATDQSFVQVLSGDNVWENRISLVKNLGNLRFILIDNTGVEHNVGLEIGDWAPGEAHRVTATWGEALMSLYVDGRKVGQTTYQGALEIAPNGPIYLGYNRPGSTYVGPGGAISDFKIYGRSLGADEVGGAGTAVQR